MVPFAHVMKYDSTSSTEYLDCMEQYVSYAKEKGFSVKHAVLRMDNQADFSTPTMQRFYKQHGITVLSGGPNEHEAQHTVENLAGQINRRARAALLQAPHLNDAYFAHAVEHK